MERRDGFPRLSSFSSFPKETVQDRRTSNSLPCPHSGDQSSSSRTAGSKRCGCQSKSDPSCCLSAPWEISFGSTACHKSRRAGNTINCTSFPQFSDLEQLLGTASNLSRSSERPGSWNPRSRNCSWISWLVAEKKRHQKLCLSKCFSQKLTSTNVYSTQCSASKSKPLHCRD